MPVRLTDAEIAALLAEIKQLPADWQARFATRVKAGHRERDVEVVGADGSEFVVNVRQSLANPLDFSVILAHRPPKSGNYFRLRRYNGLSHEHSNPIEREKFLGYHIHQATERYQEPGCFREDHFAVQTGAYATIEDALGCMLRDCGFTAPGGIFWQGSLF